MQEEVNRSFNQYIPFSIPYQLAELTQTQFNPIHQIDNPLSHHQTHQNYSQPLPHHTQQFHNLITSTLSLQQDKCMAEQALQYYSSILYLKQGQIKKMKEASNKKRKKLHWLSDSLAKVQLQMKSDQQGLRLLKTGRSDQKSKIERERRLRLGAQQDKSNLYHNYGQLQIKFYDIFHEINQQRQVQDHLVKMANQSQAMMGQIQSIQRRREEQSEYVKQKWSMKQNIKAQTRKMYQKLKQLQKQDEHIKHEYQAHRQLLARLQRDQQQINTRNGQMESRYHKKGELKQEMKEKKLSKENKQKQLRELCTQESRLRKELALQSEYKQSKGKMRQDMKVGLRHNFKIIDSEADEQHSKYSNKLIKRQHDKSQSQFDDLISRFQQIKSKNKNKQGQ